LAWAIKRGQRRAMEWLAEKGSASLTIVDRGGATLQRLAADNGHAKLLWWLLEKIPNLAGLVDDDKTTTITNDNNNTTSSTDNNDTTDGGDSKLEHTSTDDTKDDNESAATLMLKKKKSVSARKRALIASIINEWQLYARAQYLLTTFCWPVTVTTSASTPSGSSSSKSKKKKSKAAEPLPPPSEAAAVTPSPPSTSTSIETVTPITREMNDTFTRLVLSYLHVTSEMFFATDTEPAANDDNTAATVTEE
jgi:hypothetical protein